MGDVISRSVAVALVIFLAAGCGSLPSNFEMYPQAVAADRTVDDRMAVLLVGNAGPATVNYLQFVHSVLPAINAHNIVLPPNSIVAVPVPVGISNLELNTYTIAGAGGGYLPNGMSVGYIPVHTPRMNVATHGVYYVATLYSDAPKKFTVTPDTGMLRQFKRTHPQIGSLKAINFSWPK